VVGRGGGGREGGAGSTKGERQVESRVSSAAPRWRNPVLPVIMPRSRLRQRDLAIAWLVIAAGAVQAVGELGRERIGARLQRLRLRPDAGNLQLSPSAILARSRPIRGSQGPRTLPSSLRTAYYPTPPHAAPLALNRPRRRAPTPPRTLKFTRALWLCPTAASWIFRISLPHAEAFRNLVPDSKLKAIEASPLAARKVRLFH
jgi:hypothetical protein